jgi:predicted nucleic acid-binding Zn ribbon protein
VSISFKGSGFYSTDYRGRGSEKVETAKNGEADTKAKSSGDKSSSTDKAAGKQDR